MSNRDYREVSNSDDVIDSRDVIAMVNDLESQIEDLESDLSDLENQDGGIISDSDIAQANEYKSEIQDLQEELRPVKALADECEGYADDWQYGATLIRDSYWQEYAEEMAIDIGDLPKDLPAYIESNINWEGVAEDLQQDYTSVDFDGVTYWVR